MRRLTLLAIVLISAAAVTACSSSSNPAAPSNGLGSGAIINGSIVAPGGSGGTGSLGGSSTMSTMSMAATVPAGLTVAVANTNISAAVDAAGQFSLKNVPPGNADLRFSFPGFQAGLPLADLQAGQTVSIAVSLTTSTVELESDRRALGSEQQLEGRVESLPPTTAAGALTVAGQLVTTNSTTMFTLHGQPAAFADLELGQRVHVKGQMTGAGSTASLLAREVKIQNTNTSTGLNLNGVISGFSGTATAFQFTVNGTTVKGDANTEFFGNSQFAELVNGALVEVKGSQRDGYVYATRIHIEREEIEFTAAIASIGPGTAPDLTLTIGAYQVKTSAATDVRRNGDTQDVTVLYVGQTVEVTGSLLPGNIVIARKIQIEADVVGGIFEMEGSVGGLSGTCPTISFSVSGYAITTTAVAPATTFTPSCAALSNGTKVLVKGTFQAGLIVRASAVTKK